MSGSPYRIIELHRARPSLLAAAAEARRRGDLPLFVRAAEWVLSELVRTPSEFGESGPSWPSLGIQGRHGAAGPVFVDYGVDEANRLVYIRWFKLVR